MGKAKRATAILLTVLMVSTIGFLMTSRRAESSDASRIGRYQLVVGYYESTVGKGPPRKGDGVIRRGGVFRIDTATGETWVLDERIDTSSIIEVKYDREWVRID